MDGFPKWNCVFPGVRHRKPHDYSQRSTHNIHGARHNALDYECEHQRGFCNRQHKIEQHDDYSLKRYGAACAGQLKLQLQARRLPSPKMSAPCTNRNTDQYWNDRAQYYEHYDKFGLCANEHLRNQRSTGKSVHNQRNLHIYHYWQP